MNINDNSLKLFQQDIVFINNPELLNTITDSKIEEYLNNGGHLVIIPRLNYQIHDFSKNRPFLDTRPKS